jgi:amino acid adenylation domain-containing protein
VNNNSAKKDILVVFDSTGEQREIWNSCQYDEQASLCFNESISIELVGKLDVDCLKASIQELINRHAALRSFFSIDGKKMLVNNRVLAQINQITFESYDEIKEVEKRECLNLFDLANGPLIRFVLCTPSKINQNSKSYLIMTAHHIVCDGWSWAILTSDLGHFYNGERNKEYRALERASQYWEYSEYKAKLDKSIDEEFWKNKFSNPQKVIDYHTQFKRPEFRTFNSQRIDTSCPEHIIKALRIKAREKKVTIYQYLLAAFFTTLSKKSGQKDITVGISQAGQTIPQFSSLVGHCVGLLPIRIDNFDSNDFEKNLNKVKISMLEAQKHSSISFGEICEFALQKRDPSRVPLVPITFNLDVQPEGQGLNFDGLRCKFATNPRCFENFEMFINLTLIGDKAVIENQYNTDLYSKDEIQRFQNVYRDYLSHLAEAKDSESFDFANRFGSLRVIQDNFVEDQSNDKASIVPTILKAEIPESFVNEIKDIWRRVLLVSDIQSASGFFELGGHSLLVTEIILVIKKQMGITLTMKDLFLNQEFQKFVTVVYEKSSLKSDSPVDDTLNIETNNLNYEQLLPLAWQQQRTWLFQQTNKESTLFNLSAFFQFKGELNVDALRKALIYFQKSHALLNTKLVTEKGIPYWSWDRESNKTIEVEVVDLRKEYPGLSISDIITKLVELHTNEANKSFDLSGNLYKTKIYSYPNGEESYTFLAHKVHHIIWDGWCYDIFLEQLEENYNRILNNLKLDNPLELTYFDYVKWQSDLPNKEHYLEKLKYWHNEFAQLPEPLELPILPSYKRVEKSFAGKSHFIEWSEEQVAPLENIARDNGTTLFNVLMTVFKLFLARYSGQEDIVVGTPIRGRDIDDLDKVIGFFVNNVAIRTLVDSRKTFSVNLKRVVEKSTLAFENGLVPFDVIVRDVVKERDVARTPLYQAFFMFQDATNRNENFSGCQRSIYPLPRGACHTDVDFWARRDRSGMIGGLDFDSEIFSSEQMEQMTNDFKFFMSEVAALEKEHKAISTAYMLSPEHRQYIIDDLNDTSASYPKAMTIAQLIDEVASENLDKVAVSSSYGEISYSELKKYSDSLARYLIDQGVKKGDLVGMALPRNHYLPVCLLAIIKAGAGYVPLDPTYPEDRLSYMIEHSGLSFLLVDIEDKDLKIFDKVNKVVLDDPTSSGHTNSIWNMPVDNSLENIANSIDTENTCYVIYTSGSTGRPKGVDISHKSMVNFLESMKESPGVNSDDTLIAVTTLSFDIAVLEIYTPLLVGAKLYMCTKDEAMFGDALMGVITNVQGTVMQATPATWRQLVVSGLGKYCTQLSSKGVKFKSLCGGEPLPTDLKDSLLSSVDEVWNMYGPTETTVWSTCYRITKDAKWISIGRPIANTQIYILSENLELCPYGGVGELCIGGDGLAKGYLNREDLTAERFVSCTALGGKIIYRTGDLGRYQEDGLLECLGRNDGQVKVRGFRIELGEIESIISQVASIKSQVVVVREDRPGDARICAYFIRHSGYQQSEAEVIGKLRNKIKENLPFYMMPAHFIEMSEFPLTLNGKIDRKSLPAPGLSVETVNENVTNDAPISELRSELEKIWCECLGCTSVNDTDDFFKMGGHSLLSVTLFSKIETRLKITLPLSVLFQNSTFGELLKQVDARSGQTNTLVTTNNIDSDYIVTLRKTDHAKNAIFLFHGVGGNILNYKNLIKFIPDSYDVYGIQSPGVHGEAELAKSIHEMAILYANDISKIMTYEKHLFGGGSMGGLMAFEAAREVLELEKNIDDIIMFDTFGPKEAFSHITDQKPPSFISRLTTYSYFKVREINAKFHYWLASLNNRPVPHKYRHFLVELNNYRLMYSHRVSELDVHVDLLRAPLSSKGNYSLDDLGWKQVAKRGCRAHIVEETNHGAFVESPLVGKALRKILEGE